MLKVHAAPPGSLAFAPGVCAPLWVRKLRCRRFAFIPPQACPPRAGAVLSLQNPSASLLEPCPLLVPHGCFCPFPHPFGSQLFVFLSGPAGTSGVRARMGRGKQVPRAQRLRSHPLRASSCPRALESGPLRQHSLGRGDSESGPWFREDESTASPFRVLRVMDRFGKTASLNFPLGVGPFSSLFKLLITFGN